jgi:hypothetical protein
MDAEMEDDVCSADSTENNRKIGSGGQRQYSDLLDVSTFERIINTVTISNKYS